VSSAHLEEIFSHYGPILKVDLPVDKVTKFNKGNGYVEFENRADAEQALKFMDGVQFF
jgi:RNA recognition motif-containing protein